MFGIFLGAGVMFWQQSKYRKQEMEKIVKLTENILQENDIKATAPGEESLYAKIEYQMIRVQEMMQGRKDAAEKSRDDIQNLISEIAHQMRTPLTNVEMYLGFLKEKLEKEFVIDGTDDKEILPKYVTAVRGK